MTDEEYDLYLYRFNRRPEPPEPQEPQDDAIPQEFEGELGQLCSDMEYAFKEIVALCADEKLTRDDLAKRVAAIAKAYEPRS